MARADRDTGADSSGQKGVQRPLARQLPNWSFNRPHDDELVIQHQDGTGIVLVRGQEGSLEGRLLRSLIEDLLEE